MNPETIDSEYAQLESEANDTAKAIAAFSAKLQAAAGGGDSAAREWLLDLKGLALQLKQEQLQTQALLQALHDFVVGQLSGQLAGSGETSPAGTPGKQPAPATVAQPAYRPRQGRAGGLLSRFSGGGFGRAILTGAGFGIGDDIVNQIARSL